MGSRIFFALFFFSIYSSIAFSQNEVVINVQYIKQLDYQSLPAVQKMKLGEYGANLNASLFEGNFTPRFNLSLNYAEDKSRQLNRFVPVTSPTKMARIGLMKNTSYGVSIEGNFLAEQFSNNFLTNSTTVGAEFKVGLDLYKDIFGRTSRKKLKNLQLENKIKAFEENLFTNQVKINFLKLFWSLVANQESIKITNTLIEQAKRQVNVTQEKVNNSISDKGTLARMQSILSSRQGSLNSLHYQKSNLLRSLRENVPELSQVEIELGNYDISKTINDVFVCTNVLEQYKAAPLENTNLDEISMIQQEISENENLLADIHDDVDLKLFAQSKVVGKDFDYSNGITNLKDDPQLITQFGVVLSAPLGDNFSNSSKLMKNVAQTKGKITHFETLAKLNSYHLEILNSIKVLKLALKNQAENTESLKESLSSSRLKFTQARIGIEQLVGEEDAYFVSEINNISTNLSIIHTLLDYYSVFNLTECSLKN